MNYIEKIAFWLVLALICSTVGAPDACYNACFLMIAYNANAFINDFFEKEGK